MQTTEVSLWQQFAAPFADSEISTATDARGRGYRYISAPVCRKRLNDLLGPGSWQTTVSYHGDTATLHLTIIDRQGDPIKRGAIGHDEPDRPADDVAFTRACELFGIGAYLAVGEDRYARRAPAATAASAPAPPPRDDRPAPPPPARDERDEYRDERPARDDRPARREEYDDRGRDRDRGGYQGGGGGRNGYPRSNGDRGSRGPRQGGGWGNGPRPGGHAYKWLKEQEENHPQGAGLVDHIARWLKGRGMSARISDLTQHDLYEVVDEVNDYLSGAGARR